MNTLEIFETALEKQRKFGHSKKVWQFNTGTEACYCIGGLIGSTMVGMKEDEYFLLSAEGLDLVEFDEVMQTFCRANNITDADDQQNAFLFWNDAPERTKEDVIVALEKAVEYVKKNDVS